MSDSTIFKGKELQDCLAYFEAQSKVMAFQVKEAELFDNTEITSDSYLSEMHKAAKRRSQAATEVLRRYEAIGNVPSAASQVHRTWHTTIVANEAWASAYAEAFEAMANGKKADFVHIQQLEAESQNNMKFADEEERKFVNQLGISNSRIDDMATFITAEINTNDSWKPSL